MSVAIKLIVYALVLLVIWYFRSVADHLNHYVYYPVTGWLDGDVLQISEKWTFITPG